MVSESLIHTFKISDKTFFASLYFFSKHNFVANANPQLRISSGVGALASSMLS
jgi:hypothetical protein